MTIGKKLTASFSIIILILIGMSIFSIMKIKEIDKDYTVVLEDRVHKVVKIAEIQNSTSLQGLYLRSYLLRQNNEDLESLSKQIETTENILTEIDPLFKTEQMRKEIDTIKEKQQFYNQYVDEILSSIKAGKQDNAYDVFI